ncbi:hypothetical protein AB0B42_29420, partial [Streptomyces fradiae]
MQKTPRRKPRRLILATAAAAVLATAGTVAYQGMYAADAPSAVASGPRTAVVPAAAAPSAAPEPAASPARDEKTEPITEVPKSDPRKGMVYKGLKPAPENDSCEGVYRTDSGHCTHGPDAPPPGVDITARDDDEAGHGVGDRVLAGELAGGVGLP